MNYRSLTSAMTALQNPVTDTDSSPQRQRKDFPENTVVVQIDDGWGLQEIEQAIRDTQQAMLTLSEESGSIKTQLEHAKAKRYSQGEWSDPDWWARANAALRHMARQSQSYQLTLGELNRRRRAKLHEISDRDDGRMFISCAKEALSPERYMSIWAEVRRRQQG
jgi:hypothetical protein